MAIALAVLAITKIYVSNAQTTFLVDVDKTEKFFGDPLTVTVTVTPWAAEIYDPIIEIRVPLNFSFTKADVSCALCEYGNVCEYHQESVEGNQSATIGSRITFDNRAVDDSKIIITLAQNESVWESGVVFKSVIQFQSVWSSDIDRSAQYVIGRLRYRKMISDANGYNESAELAERMSGWYVSIVPVTLSIFLDGAEPKNGSQTIFQSIEVAALIDRRVGDAYLKFPIPAALTITQASYIMGRGSKSVVDLPIPADNELSIFLTEFAFGDMVDEWCVEDRCQVQLLVDVSANPKNKSESIDRKPIGIKATVFYGLNLKSKVESETLFIRIYQDGNATANSTDTIVLAEDQNEENNSTQAAVTTASMTTPATLKVGELQEIDNSAHANTSSSNYSSNAQQEAHGDEFANNLSIDNTEISEITGNTKNQSSTKSPESGAGKNETKSTPVPDSDSGYPIIDLGNNTAPGDVEIPGGDLEPMDHYVYTPVTEGPKIGELREVENSTRLSTTTPPPPSNGQTETDDEGQSANNTSIDNNDILELSISSCRDGWWTLELQMADRCYHFPNEKRSFEDAENHCREMGAHLPSYHSPYGMLTLSTFWKNQIKATELWLGLSKPDVDKQWKWSDGSHYDYHNWCEIEELQSWYNCTVISDTADNGYCWSNKACSQEFYFVCYEPARQQLFWW